MIYLHKSDLMERLQHLVSHGYTRWTGGTVAAGKLQALILKFSDRYGTERTQMQRYRAKARGEANAQLCCIEAEPGVYAWWLLATPGAGLVHQMETLADATSKKARITTPGADYELVQTPRKGLPASWTWRMTPDTEEAWRERIKTAIRRHNDSELRQAWHSLCRIPGFRECRAQGFALMQFAKGEWKRSRSGDWPLTEGFIAFRGRRKTARTEPAQDAAKRAQRKTRKKAATPPAPDNPKPGL